MPRVVWSVGNGWVLWMDGVLMHLSMAVELCNVEVTASSCSELREVGIRVFLHITNGGPSAVLINAEFAKRGQEKWGDRAGGRQVLPHHIIICTCNINENKASTEVSILSCSQRLSQEKLRCASPARAARAKLCSTGEFSFNRQQLDWSMGAGKQWWFQFFQNWDCGCTAHGVVNPTKYRNGVDSCCNRWRKQLVASLPEIGPCNVRCSFVWGEVLDKSGGGLLSDKRSNLRLR
eukprot:155594-Amphidinium_carterae.1